MKPWQRKWIESNPSDQLPSWYFLCHGWESFMAPLLCLTTTSARRNERRPKALRDALELLRNRASRYSRYASRLCNGDGVREAAGAAECRGIFDLLASDVAPLLTSKANDGTSRMSILAVRVVDSCATLEATNTDDVPPLWFRNIPGTDSPQGQGALFEFGLLEFDAIGCRSIVASLLSKD